MQVSDWRSDSLSDEQILYAAVDSITGLGVQHKFHELGLTELGHLKIPPDSDSRKVKKRREEVHRIRKVNEVTKSIIKRCIRSTHPKARPLVGRMMFEGEHLKKIVKKLATSEQVVR